LLRNIFGSKAGLALAAIQLLFSVFLGLGSNTPCSSEPARVESRNSDYNS
jgi:hypothetical protein